MVPTSDISTDTSTFCDIKVDRRPVCGGPPIDNNFLEEGSPTMVERGMDPGSMFEMCDDDDDNGIHDVKESGMGGVSLVEGVNAAAAATAAAAAAAASAPSVASGPEISMSTRHRRKGRHTERSEPKSKKESWMDPPEEKESNTLAQAEMESCMQTYAVSCQLLKQVTLRTLPKNTFSYLHFSVSHKFDIYVFVVESEIEDRAIKLMYDGAKELQYLLSYPGKRGCNLSCA